MELPFDRETGLLSGSLSRRGFAAGATGVALGIALDECGGSSSSSSSSAAALTPKRGGTLTVAASGGGPADSLNPYTSITSPGVMATDQVYEPLVRWGSNGEPQLVLAEELEPNKAGTEWTIRVHSGVTFHDGQPFTSADVIATLHQWAKGSNTSSAVAGFDVGGAKALDTHTVRVSMHSPLFIVPDILAWFACLVTPAHWNPGRPNGTGPFKLVSFSPGRQTSLTRNPNYWQSEKPYLDAVVINDFADETAQVNALQSGEANAASNFSVASAKVLETSGVKLLSRITRGGADLAMNRSAAPFTDVRVRQALKLVIDRPQMAEAVFGRYGAIANDTFAAPSDPLYVALPQRQQDLEQAKTLLAQAGRSGLTIKLTSAPVAQGLPQTAEVFAQQAKGAGVNVVLDPVTPDVIYGPEFLKWGFTTTFEGGDGYLVSVGETMLPNSSYPETHFNNARFTSLWNQAVAASDLSLRREIAGEMQKIEYDEGGYIAPMFLPILDAHAASVHGLQAGVEGTSFSNNYFTDAWIS
jgi:peptide/nickel transport system substrate-binding protein